MESSESGRPRRNRRGATVIEYILIGALLSIVVGTGVVLSYTALSSTFHT